MSSFKIITAFMAIVMLFFVSITPIRQAEETSSSSPSVTIKDPLPEVTPPLWIEKDEAVPEENPKVEIPKVEEIEEFIPDPPCEVTGAFKSWTPYTIYAKWSKQHKLQQIAYTDENGLRKVGEYFCVALGSYYGDEVGLLYEITLEDNGEYKTFKAVLCDQKSDRHTDSTHRYTKKHGCMVEFAIDIKVAQNANSIVYHGTVSALEEFRGCVVKIKNIGKMDIVTGEVTLY
jgi:hypothetical protein